MEDDGTVTLALDHYDLVVNGTDQESALDSMVAELREYAEEYYDNIRFWSSDPLRKKQIKGILKVLLTVKDEIPIKSSRKVLADPSGRGGSKKHKWNKGSGDYHGFTGD